jgi:hypothetical protein
VADNGDVDPRLLSPAHSRDGNWWWDGQGWYSAHSQDRRWWFDGQRWIASPNRLTWPRWLLAGTVIWLLLLVAWEPATTIAVLRADKFDDSAATVLVITAAIAALATLFWGCVLGRTRRWRQLAISTAMGAGALLVGYVAIMLATASPDDPTVDNAAGAGLAMAAVPTVIVVGAVLFFGAGIGRLLAILRTRASN